MRGAVAAVACFLLALTAGCAARSQVQDGPEVPAELQHVEVTHETGAIRGIVVTASITPIPDATVKISSLNLTKKTSVSGAFSFSKLKPGTYFLEASKLGFSRIQTSTVVVAGDDEPPLVKIQLVEDLATRPYWEIQQWKAFLQCGAWAVAVTTNPCALTGSDNVHRFIFGGNRTPEFSQGEVLWSGTQPLGNYLSFSIHDPKTATSSCKGVNSASPAKLNMTKAEITKCWGDKQYMDYKIFPGATPGTPPTPTVVINQDYRVYVSYFYGFAPRAGWMFVKDGECTRPEQCA